MNILFTIGVIIIIHIELDTKGLFLCHSHFSNDIPDKSVLNYLHYLT